MVSTSNRQSFVLDMYTWQINLNLFSSPRLAPSLYVAVIVDTTRWCLHRKRIAKSRWQEDLRTWRDTNTPHRLARRTDRRIFSLYVAVNTSAIYPSQFARYDISRHRLTTADGGYSVNPLLIAVNTGNRELDTTRRTPLKETESSIGNVGRVSW